MRKLLWEDNGAKTLILLIPASHSCAGSPYNVDLFSDALQQYQIIPVNQLYLFNVAKDRRNLG